MSAFVVSHDHIDYLVSAALQLIHPSYGDTYPGDRDQYGRVLLEENLRSIIHLYPDVLEGGSVPGTIGQTPAGYRFQRVPIDPDNVEELAQVIKACQCWKYQTCETPDHRETYAWRIVESIEAAAIRHLPGYEDAEWEWDRPRVEEHAS